MQINSRDGNVIKHILEYCSQIQETKNLRITMHEDILELQAFCESVLVEV